MRNRGTGRYSKAICDRCGFKFNWTDLVTERHTESNIKVCVDCNDTIPDNLRWKGPFVKEILPWTRPDIPLYDPDDPNNPPVDET